MIIARHEDVLHNLGIAGHDFIAQNQGLVTEMQRKFMDYVKSGRVEAAGLREQNADSGRAEVRMTSDGYPIIPKLVMDQNLKKVELEKMLRAYLTQHYCE